MSSFSADASDQLVVGNKLRCPHCEKLGDVLLDFRPLNRPDKFKNELNIVQKCRKESGGCGHVFSPGDPWVMEKYLSGELIPKQLLDEANKIIKQQQILLHNITSGAQNMELSA